MCVCSFRISFFRERVLNTRIIIASLYHKSLNNEVKEIEKMQDLCYYFSMTKEDRIASSAIGFLVAILLLTIKLSGNIPHLSRIPLLETSILIFPLLSLLGMYIASSLAKRIAILLQLIKFLYVGALNTFVDLAILNILIWFSSMSTGFEFTLFKGISFIAAMMNSYVWNKFWTKL